jgi:type I restriction enzyme, S subunit
MSPNALDPAKISRTIGEDTGLPAGWLRATLSDVAAVNPSTDFDVLAADSAIPFIPMAAVTEETGVIDALQRRTVDAVRKGYVRFREADVIFAKITPCMENGKTAPVLDIPGGYAAGSTEFHVLRPRCVDTKYLWYWLVRRAFRQEAERNMSGSAGQLRVPADYLRRTPIPIAPLPEQRRIVARIDELFTEIAEGEDALARARQGLGSWRRALLKAAVTGELTRNWREANRPAETGADDAIVLRDASVRTVGPHAIPSGWIWTTIGRAGQVLLGRQRAPQHHNGPHMRPYLRVANVLEDRIDMSDVKSMNFTPSEFEKYHLLPGDILLNEGQSSDLVGRSAIYRGEIKDCCFQKTLLRFRTDERVSPQYAQIVFLHYLHSKRFRRAAPITTNMAHLTLERLLPIEFPLPPREEQDLIVHGYHEAREAIDEIALALSDRERNSLRQSILKAAFEGRLVPQDPRDEPASVLLARLRDCSPSNGARRRRARAAADVSHPSLPGLTHQPLDPRAGPAGYD